MESPKMKKPINILVCGLGWSGSGTVIGLLSEYKDIIQIPGGPLEVAPAGYIKYGEFDFFRSQGMIGDYLNDYEKYFPQRYASKIIKRLVFKNKVMSFLDIKTIRSLGFNEAFKSMCQLNKVYTSLIHLFEKMDAETSYNSRIELATGWLAHITTIFNAQDKKGLILDQPIHLGQHGDIWREFYNPYKMIFVYRDPRDIIAEQEKHLQLFRQQMNSNVICIYGDSMQNAIQYTIKSLLSRINKMEDILKNDKDNHVMGISFEEMVTNYEGSKKRIEDFIGLSETDHVLRKRYFDPSWSVKNMGIYKQSKIDFSTNDFNEIMDWYDKKQNN